MNKIAFYSTIITGILIIASFFPYAYNGLILLNKLPVYENVLGLKLAWIWGAIAILLLGVWCFFLAPSIKKGVLKAKAQVFLLGLGLCAFGFGSLIIQKEVNEYLVFGFEGLLLILPSLFITNESV